MCQVDELITMLENDANIDYVEDWKLVTVWIGTLIFLIECRGLLTSTLCRRQRFVRVGMRTRVI